MDHHPHRVDRVGVDGAGPLRLPPARAIRLVLQVQLPAFELEGERDVRSVGGGVVSGVGFAGFPISDQHTDHISYRLLAKEKKGGVQLEDHQTLLNHPQREPVADVIGLPFFDLVGQGVVLGANVVLLAVVVQGRDAVGVAGQLDVEVVGVRGDLLVARFFEVEDA